MQCIQLSNQSFVFEICPDAASRINTIFMTTYFIGGSFGTLLAGIAWKIDQWHGVACAGILLLICSLLVSMAENTLQKRWQTITGSNRRRPPEAT
jgi:MFS family permease